MLPINLGIFDVADISINQGSSHSSNAIARSPQKIIQVVKTDASAKSAAFKLIQPIHREDTTEIIGESFKTVDPLHTKIPRHGTAMPAPLRLTFRKRRPGAIKADLIGEDNIGERPQTEVKGSNIPSEGRVSLHSGTGFGR